MAKYVLTSVFLVLLILIFFQPIPAQIDGYEFRIENKQVIKSKQSNTLMMAEQSPTLNPSMYNDHAPKVTLEKSLATDLESNSLHD